MGHISEEADTISKFLFLLPCQNTMTRRFSCTRKLYHMRFVFSHFTYLLFLPSPSSSLLFLSSLFFILLPSPFSFPALPPILILFPSFLPFPLLFLPSPFSSFPFLLLPLPPAPFCFLLFLPSSSSPLALPLPLPLPAPTRH